MIKFLLALSSVLLFAAVTVAATPTMRLDYYHTGDASSEVFSVDRVAIEPLPWPGHPSQAIDSSNLGKYFFEVRDAKTKQPLYSRGFASIYGEWETTDEAKTIKRTFQESLRFPAPTAPVTVVLKKRDTKNVFQDIWTATIDPADQFIDRSKPLAPAPLITIQKTGEPEDRVDLPTCSSRRRLLKRIAGASTCGHFVRRQPSRGYRGLLPASIATHLSARLTMHLDPSATF